MKKLKKILFTILVLFVGVINVNAELTSSSQEVNLKKWQSIVEVYDESATNGCEVTIGSQYIDYFVYESPGTCVATGIGEVDIKDGGFLLKAQANATAAHNYSGSVVASINNMKDSNILLSEIVELIYSETSATTRKLKEYAMSNTSKAGSATKYILKAGSSSNALYVYGGYDNQAMSGIKLNYNSSTKEFTYSIVPTTDNVNEYVLAFYFTKYLTDYLMEASAGYNEAITILNDESKYNKIKDKIENTYGRVAYRDSGDIEVKLLATGDINSQIVTLYNEAVATGNNTGGSAGGTTGGSNNVGNANGNAGNKKEEKNPNTGAFVNAFAIIALLSVGTVLVLGSKRKLFKI